MGADVKKNIIDEINSRIKRLEAHEDDEIMITGNQYDELNQALSKVIGKSLKKELESIKEFIENE